MDLKHEDLVGVLWTNNGERAGDGKDNDNNGYIDDIHGYNFLGDSYNEQLEAARILRLGLGDASMQAKAKAKVDSDRHKSIWVIQAEFMIKCIPSVDAAHKAIVKKHLGKERLYKKRRRSY